MNDLSTIQTIAVWIIPVLFAVTLHEVAHGWVASLFGDQTARLMGRLTINPVRHIDPVGTILVPLTLMILTHFQFIFGWAKPVPVDQRNMARPRTDMAIVALAGPLANIAMAFFWGMIAKMGVMIDAGDHRWVALIYMGAAGIQINVILAVLNLIPLPPLDGSNILSGILPRRAAYQFSRIAPYGFFILLVLMFTGVLSKIMMPVVFMLINLIGLVFGLV
jgi:Zn-dependent protease